MYKFIWLFYFFLFENITYHLFIVFLFVFLFFSFLKNIRQFSPSFINILHSLSVSASNLFKNKKTLLPYAFFQRNRSSFNYKWASFCLWLSQGRNYYVYRYEGNLNGIENAIVLFSYPEKAFGKPKALRAFLCMDVSLSTNEILDNYICRWPIEVFFRQCKDKLALDSYQIRSAQGIRRYWLIMSFAHYMCVVGTGKVCPFETGYRKISDIIQMEKYRILYQCARKCNDFGSFLKSVA